MIRKLQSLPINLEGVVGRKYRSSSIGVMLAMGKIQICNGIAIFAPHARSPGAKSTFYFADRRAAEAATPVAQVRRVMLAASKHSMASAPLICNTGSRECGTRAKAKSYER